MGAGYAHALPISEEFLVVLKVVGGVRFYSARLSELVAMRQISVDGYGLVPLLSGYGDIEEVGLLTGVGGAVQFRDVLQVGLLLHNFHSFGEETKIKQPPRFQIEFTWNIVDGQPGMDLRGAMSVEYHMWFVNGQIGLNWGSLRVYGGIMRGYTASFLTAGIAIDLSGTTSFDYFTGVYTGGFIARWAVNEAGFISGVCRTFKHRRFEECPY